MLGVYYFLGSSLVAVSRGYSLFAVRGFLIEVASLVESTGSRPMGFSSFRVKAPQLWLPGTGSIVVAMG